MESESRSDRVRLLNVASIVGTELSAQKAGTSLRIHRSPTVSATDTDGWSADLGDLGKGRPSLEIWYCRFAGHADRKLSACFWSATAAPVRRLAERVSRSLPPIRRIQDDDVMGNGRSLSLAARLSQDEFHRPIVELYQRSKNFFFGIYDPTYGSLPRLEARFAERAVAFFLAVARSHLVTDPQHTGREVYPQWENRMRVEAHLRRERSSYLASECKRRDGYRCQVCGVVFANIYGDVLGAAFAECHHLVPLAQKAGSVRTCMDDLITVCANCHRMLHRMEGKPGDIRKLQSIVRHRWGNANLGGGSLRPAVKQRSAPAKRPR